MSDTTPLADAPVRPLRRFRRLRIAVSAFFAVMCIAIIALWIRGNWRTESIWITARPNGYNNDYNGSFEFGNSAGGLVMTCFWTTGFRVFTPYRFEIHSTSYRWTPESNWPVRRLRGGLQLLIPHWFSVSLVVLLNAILWIPFSRRFRLRTLLIATTLLAAMLGLSVWCVS